VLGPVRLDGGGPLEPRDRTRCSSSWCCAGQVVPPDRFAEALWGDHPPASWAKQVQICVGRLRKRLGLDGDRDGVRRLPADHRRRGPRRGRGSSSSLRARACSGPLDRPTVPHRPTPVRWRCGVGRRWLRPTAGSPDASRLHGSRSSGARPRRSCWTRASPPGSTARSRSKRRRRRRPSRCGNGAGPSSLWRGTGVADRPMRCMPSGRPGRCSAISSASTSGSSWRPSRRRSCGRTRVSPRSGAGERERGLPLQGARPLRQLRRRRLLRSGRRGGGLSRAAADDAAARDHWPVRMRQVLPAPSGAGAGPAPPRAHDGRARPRTGSRGSDRRSVSSAGEGAVLAIDQFEELFAPGSQPEVVRLVCHQLAQYASDRGQVVLAVRSDHLGGLAPTWRSAASSSRACTW
jgi:hypothetical protein